MPTIDEFEELFRCCKVEWTETDGVSGYRFTGPNGNSIFMPAAGSRVKGAITGIGTEGRYMSGSVNGADAKAAIESSVARLTITDWDGYRHSLNKIASQCSDGVCYSQLLNSRRTLEKVSRELGYKL